MGSAGWRDGSVAVAVIIAVTVTIVSSTTVSVVGSSTVRVVARSKVLSSVAVAVTVVAVPSTTVAELGSSTVRVVALSEMLLVAVATAESLEEVTDGEGLEGRSPDERDVAGAADPVDQTLLVRGLLGMSVDSVQLQSVRSVEVDVRVTVTVDRGRAAGMRFCTRSGGPRAAGPVRDASRDGAVGRAMADERAGKDGPGPPWAP